MGDRWFVKEPCRHCPFRRDVVPFLHPVRVAEIARWAWNPYSSFPCHKTLGHDDEGETVWTADSLECAGFLTMQIWESGRRIPDGFTVADGVYSDPYEMEEAYTEAWERLHGRLLGC